jgi:hypothetical protein
VKPVRYALLQETLEPPGIEPLKRAFTAVRCLVDSDAHGLANDAYGILVRDLTAEDAHRLQGALRVEGIGTELIPVPSLPQIPPTKFVRRIEFGPDMLLLYDPIGRPVPIEWRHLLLIAAGRIPAGRIPAFGSTRGTEPELMLEVVLTHGVARFSLAVDGVSPVLFRCLGERQGAGLNENFHRLIAALAQASPKAMLNRGAWFLRQSPPTWFDYPSKNAFFEEVIWMLHRARKAGA